MSSGGGAMAIAVPAALAGAVSFAATGALQYRATKEVAARRSLSPRLLVDLAHRPEWAAAVGTTIAGIGLQVLALRFGPLVLIQPLLVTGLVFAVVISAALDRRRPDRVMLFGALLCVAGLTTFLVAARPSGDGATTLSPAVALPLALGLGITLLCCLFASYHLAGVGRAIALALGTGVIYGVTAGLIKIVMTELSDGWATPFHDWPLYTVCVVGPLGFLLSQNAFQAGPLVAPPLAVITTVDPLVGIAIGLLWLDEEIRLGPATLALEVLGLVVMTGGIVALAHRAPQVQQQAVADGGDVRGRAAASTT